MILIDDVAEFYRRLSNDIANARASIRLEMYTLQEGEIVRALVASMAERAAAGLSVSLIYDAVGSYGLSETTLAPLRQAGGRTLAYHPIHPRRMEGGFQWSTLFRRDHRKLAVIDDAIWYVGGMNIGERFLSWKDLVIRGKGAPVAELVEGFDRVMNQTKPSHLKPPLLDVHRPVVALDSRPTFGVYPVKRMYMKAIKKAKRRIWIAQAYFLPRHRLRKALAHAQRRGVDVRVIVPDRSDVKVADVAAWTPIGKLVKQGVAIHRFHAGMLHTKMALIDDTLIVGAANLDSMSLYWNRELSLMTRSEEIVADAERIYTRYQDETTRTTMATIRGRSVADRLAGWLLKPFFWIL